MVIFDYTDAVVSRDIRRIRGNELSLVQKLAESGSEQDAVFRGTYEGKIPEKWFFWFSKG